MKKEQLEIEVNKLMTELATLEENATLEAATTSFLSNEADKLLLKSEDKSLSPQEKEEVCKQMDALQKRISIEQDSMFKGMRRLAELTDRFNYLKTVTPED